MVDEKVISMLLVVAMLTTIFAAMIPQTVSAATMTVEIGKVTAAVGSKVEIPITLKGVPSKGMANCDFDTAGHNASQIGRLYRLPQIEGKYIHSHYNDYCKGRGS